MYRITFNLTSPICFIDRPIFDSILARCYIFEREGYIPQKLNIDQPYDFKDMPLVLHPDGYFLASIMYFDNNINFTGSWKKRWANKHDNIADFGKQKRKIKISGGEYKSYDIPLNLYSIDKIWFYFESSNVKEVNILITNHLIGIGKKVSQGYGWFSKIDIEESNKSFDTELLRPIPKDLTKLKGDEKYCGWKIPYWMPGNMTLCKYPNGDI